MALYSVQHAVENRMDSQRASEAAPGARPRPKPQQGRVEKPKTLTKAKVGQHAQRRVEDSPTRQEPVPSSRGHGRGLPIDEICIDSQDTSQKR